ncbi:hypothetical protein M0805_000478 [Coniferiporia weirii]|nr:hypothetical protein M0805_000478 [Coniferiporia weirii]
MLDNIVGRPSLSWRRRETISVLFFTLYCILTSSKRGPRILWIRPLNRLLQRFTPYQLIALTLSVIYALRNIDKLFGFGRASDFTSGKLYSREYNRATWVVTALDAGFATAMSIRPKWLRDICSMVFSIHYMFHADEAESKVHRLRELCSLDVLRVTWDKTNDNPYLRAISAPFRPSLPIYRHYCIPRPKHSTHTRPVNAWLFFSGSESELQRATELVLDFPGGGFVAMGPMHHEERLRAWAKRTGKPVLSVDYGKAPEFPYPYAIEEGFDLYCTLVESAGRIIGMSGSALNIVISGDSAGGNIAVNVMFKIIEATTPNSPLSHLSLPSPAGLALVYAALNFSFAAWTCPSGPTPSPSSAALDASSASLKRASSSSVPFSSYSVLPPTAKVVIGSLDEENRKLLRAVEPSSEDLSQWDPSKNVVHQQAHASLFERHQAVQKALGPIEGKTPLEKTRISQLAGSRLTMSSKAGYMHDRIITPSMAWAMCLLYLGPRPAPGAERDYRLSPVFAPSSLLAAFPPILLQCGARDPLIDDTVLFGGRVREAKRTCAPNARVRVDNLSGVRLPPTPPSDDGPNASSRHGAEVNDDNDDGVTVQIFPGWSHGYLQMSALMHGARVAIDDIADWIDAAFERSRAEAEASQVGNGRTA